MARISELSYGCTGAALKIRILRKWTHHFRQNETWFLGVDTHGDSVQILGKRPNQHLLESKLRLLRCYEIEDYTCTETRAYAKTIKNPIHLNLGLASKITEIEDTETLPRHWFSFANMEEIRKPLTKDIHYEDVIGCFKGIKILKKNTGERFIKLELIHESGEELNITIWNECVEAQEKFDQDILNTTSTKTVLAITALKISEYDGQHSLNSTAATYVYRNPVILETEQLMQRMDSESFTSPTLTLTPVTVQELQAMTYSIARGKTFSVRSTIDKFTCNESWFAAFCPSCDTPIPKKGDDWFCITHGKPKTISYSFTITAVLDDTTATFAILISDETMQKMCNQSCQFLVVDLGYEDRKTIPPIVDKYRLIVCLVNVKVDLRMNYYKNEECVLWQHGMDMKVKI